MLRRNFSIAVAFLLVILLHSCTVFHNPAKIKNYVEVKTSKGDFIIGLYEGTPLHKENFLKNCSRNIYDSTLIYSTIPNSIYKIGLPTDKNELDLLNKNNQDETIDIESEFNPALLNKRGAIGMYRLPDNKNTDKISDKQLFYLVEGIKTDKKLLNTLIAKRNAPMIADYLTIFLKESGHEIYADSLNYYKSNSIRDNYRNLYLQLTDSILPRIENDGKELFSLSENQIETYTQTGGVPIYDGQYTIFGEIVAGNSILTILSKTKTGIKNKPKSDIFVLTTIILTKKEFKKLKKTEKHYN